MLTDLLPLKSASIQERREPLSNIHPRCLVSAIVFASLVAFASPVYAADDSRLAAELQNLNQSLQTLQQLMKEQLAANRLNTAIAYLNFRSRKIEVLERDLEGMKKDRERLLGFLEDLEQRGAQLEAEKRNNPSLSSQELNQAKEELELRRGMVKKRAELLENESLAIEIKIGELRSQIDSVERFVQSNLGL